jgi:hypothetical protein
MFKKRKKSIGVAALMLLVGGVAFALLQSQATLRGNSISTESANLLISQNDSNYGPSTSGYAFTGIIPGTQASQTEHFLLKNTGTAPLALTMSLASAPTSADGVDLSKVHVILTPYSTTTYMPGTPQSFSLQSLLDAGADGVAVDYPNPLAAGTKEEFNLQIDMDNDAYSGSASVSLSNLDLSFIGTAAASTTP